MAKAKYGQSGKKPPVQDQPSVINTKEGERKKMEETKYGKYIILQPKMEPYVPKRKNYPSLKVDNTSWPGLGANTNFSVYVCSEPLMAHDQPHAHDADEYLYFIGGDLTNINDLGAIVEIALGEEWEKHIITTSCVIYIPKGLIHCPLNIKKVYRPFIFGHIISQSKYTQVII